MKSGTKDQAEGKFHKVKGNLKKIAGELGDNPEQNVRRRVPSTRPSIF